MKRITTAIVLLLLFSYQCHSQSVEASLYLREELIKQQDDLLQQVHEIQARIDAIDLKLGNATTSNTEKKYITKSVNYNTQTKYSNAIKNTTTKQKQYRPKTTRTYYRGPRGGCYYINSNGNKTYVARSMCN
ncbi:hypothetical protein [Aquimarina megaterium]|uniref:hypothetical protein n=1 Tax=Aquimarina megaterium TaxID=1443666 RepID=UPI000943DFA5|nr:hypothetical protein [Aquimarina megaterium]